MGLAPCLSGHPADAKHVDAGAACAPGQCQISSRAVYPVGPGRRRVTLVDFKQTIAVVCFRFVIGCVRVVFSSLFSGLKDANCL